MPTAWLLEDPRRQVGVAGLHRNVPHAGCSWAPRADTSNFGALDRHMGNACKNTTYAFGLFWGKIRWCF